MGLWKRLGAVCVVAGAMTAGLPAQEQGYWRAESSTAKAITGDIAFSNDRLTMNFIAVTAAEIRDLKPDEVSSVFDVDASSAGKGRLFRVSIPAAKTFNRRNKLCGSEDTQWVVVYAAGKDLQMALFSGAAMPVFTRDAVSNSTDLCGTFSYVR